MAKIVAISFPKDLPAALDKEAKRQRRSRSWIVSEAVRRYLAERPKPYAIVGASFEQGTDLTLLEGLALDYTERAREAERLWNEGWPFCSRSAASASGSRASWTRLRSLRGRSPSWATARVWI